MVEYQEFVALSQSGDSEDRGRAAHMAALAYLGHTGPADEHAALYAALIGFLDDPSVKVRAALAYGLLHAREAPRPILLALLQDSGHYYVDYSKAESMAWGNGTGCSFLTEKCDQSSSFAGTYWCHDTDPNNNYCDFDKTGIGRCSVGTYGSALASYYQYFSVQSTTGGSQQLMDVCPMVQAYSNRVCNNVDHTPEANDEVARAVLEWVDGELAR